MPLTLRQRLAVALLGVSVSVAAVLGAVVWTGYLWLESTTFDRILGHELELFARAGALPPELARSGGLTLYRPALAPHEPPPAPLRALGPGSYRDFGLGAQHLHVLVRDLAPGDRVWLTYDVAVFEARERWMRAALIGGVAAVGLLSWLLSGWVAARTLRPLDSLVARIAALHPERRERLPLHGDDAELGLIVEAFNKRMAEIEALVTRERAFAGAAAHELRTPLTSIRIAAETLAAHTVAPDAAQRIERAVRAASESLDALLALSRDRAVAPAESLQLDQLLPTLAEPYAAAARDHGTQLHWQLQPVTAQLPPGPLGIIFTNLLRNAIRAAPRGSVRTELEPGRIAVVDDGEGMSADELAHVFEPGTRGPHGGSGIGLYISRVLAQRCGWHLTLRSEAGRGTIAELRFDVPARSSPEPPEPV